MVTNELMLNHEIKLKVTFFKSVQKVKKNTQLLKFLGI